jgi:small GTP-binding protein
MDEQRNVKVVLIGDTSVGKTCLAHRWSYGHFPENVLGTTGAGTFRQRIELEGVVYNIFLWDTAGQEKYQDLSGQYYRDAQAAMIVFDVTRQETLNSCQSWLDRIRKVVEFCPVILVGNKMDGLGFGDEKREILKRAEEFAEEKNIPCFKTSAVNGEGLEEAFSVLCQMAIMGPTAETVKVDVTDLPQSEGKAKCC